MKVCVLFNPKAGSAGQMAALRDSLGPRRKVAFVELTQDENLQRVAHEAAHHRFDLLVVAGGDGTVHRVINGLAPHLPRIPLAILPLGTGNDLCRTLDIPLEPDAAAGLLRKHRSRRLDLLQVEGDRTTVAINAITGGFSGRVAADVTAEQKGFWGPFAYLRGAAGPVAARETYRVTFRFDDGPPEELEVLNIVVANGRTAAGGIPVAPLANPEDGLLDVVVIPAGDLFDLSVVAARLMAGDYDADETVLHRRARKVELISDPPMPLSIDGELAEGSRFTFTVLPRAVPVVVGPGYRPDPAVAALPEDEPDEAEPANSGLGRRLFGLLAALLVLVFRMPRIYLLGLGFGLAALLGFAYLAGEVLSGQWQAANERFLRQLQANRTPERIEFAAKLTQAGDIVVTTLIGLGVLVFLVARRRYLDAATLLTVVAGCGLLELLLKGVFQVPRPELALELTPAHGWSFPSGHALRGVGLYGFLAALLVVTRPGAVWRWLVAAGLVALAVGICWSRPYLGYHYPGDVVAGGLAAIAWVCGCMIARHHARVRMARQMVTAGPGSPGGNPGLSGGWAGGRAV